jgi:hypothetical protein
MSNIIPLKQTLLNLFLRALYSEAESRAARACPEGRGRAMATGRGVPQPEYGEAIFR